MYKESISENEWGTNEKSYRNLKKYIDNNKNNNIVGGTYFPAWNYHGNSGVIM